MNITHECPEYRVAVAVLDAETALLLACMRRRRELAAELLVELNRAIEVQQPKPRTIPAPGYREVGMARFRNVRIASANEGRNRT